MDASILTILQVLAELVPLLLRLKQDISYDLKTWRSHDVSHSREQIAWQAAIALQTMPFDSKALDSERQ